MARPKHHNPRLFTGGELAHATGLAPRNIHFLRDKDLIPQDSNDRPGGLYGEDTLANLAMISGCAQAGYSLTLGAQLIGAVRAENPNHPASRFCQLDEIAPRDHNRTWFHQFANLRDSRPELALDVAQAQDSALYVADRTFVLTGRIGAPRLRTLVPEGADAGGPQPLGRMKDLVRGGDAQFESFAETQLTWDEGSDGLVWESAATGAATVAFQKAVQNALALVRVNLSLSIRRAFGRVHDLRHAKGGPMWKVGE